MAQVAVLLSSVWFCPHCDTVLKARHERTVIESAERHLMDQHNVWPQQWDIPVERRHWAFNVPPSNRELWTRSLAFRS